MTEAARLRDGGALVEEELASLLRGEVLEQSPVRQSHVDFPAPRDPRGQDGHLLGAFLLVRDRRGELNWVSFGKKLEHLASLTIVLGATEAAGERI